ncbi:MAG TPA: zinc dependent phospholipase C family protein [Flavobacteriales bacterium]
MNWRKPTYCAVGITVIILGMLFLTSFTKTPTTTTHQCALDAPAWGFFGHKRINELAVYTLPPEMFGFYKANMEYIIDHSVDPDKRRYGVVGEAECHFIDMDRYITPEYPNPFDNVPRRWTDAVAKFSEDTLRANGIVPWHVYNMLQRLTNAFKGQDKQRILRLSTELGHYIGDAHVPLHTTSNYNGQLTGQRGIHGFWESRLVELYSQDYDFFVGRAQYINSPLNYIWDRVEESFACVDSVLNFEKKLTQTFGEEKKYSFESRGQANMRVYAEEYSKAYSDMLDGQVERRMKSAVYSIGCFWYTAWVDAGQPDLNKLFGIPYMQETPSDSIPIPSIPLKVREHE